MSAGALGGLAGAGGRGGAGLLRSLPDRLAEAFLAEREQWALWLPVAVGVGIAVYFALAAEPAWWAGAAWAVAGAGLAVFAGPQRLAVFLAAWLIAASGLGFAAAQLRTALVATPMIAERLGPVAIEGRVADREMRADGSQRVVLSEPKIAGLAPAATPRQIRLSLNRKHAEGAAIGRLVSLRGVLLPASPPLAPGAFDFQRHAYFQGIGAVGFSVAPLRALPEDHAGRSLSIWLEQLREAIGGRIGAAIDGPAGPLAAALLIGDRAGIPEPVMAAMRDSGLAHLIAISGLNFALVAGILFFVVRGGLALVEPLALRHPIKKWAAVTAFAGAAFYFLVAGPSPPTERSFLMIGIVLLGVLVDRDAISMRLLAWAAAAILLVLPDVLWGASFQMSFAAVMALVAAYEGLRGRFTDWRAERGLFGRAALYVGAVVLTTVIGSAATGIYAAYHFNRFPLYGLAANLIAVPITAHWIMPWGMLAFALMPFGLEHWALVPMGWGVGAIIATAETVASWPGAVALLPAMPMAGLLAATAGLIWLCLWRGRWRVIGIVPILAGLAAMGLARSPDILVSGDARMMAVRGLDGKLLLSSDGGDRLTTETWMRRAGQTATAPFPAGRNGRVARRPMRGEDDSLRCDGQACLYRRDGRTAALVREASALAEECAGADVVISAVPVRRGCAGAALVVDRFALWRGGAHAIWLGRHATRVETVAEARGDRPWVARRGRRAISAD
ncbi:MAG: ComEC/Rec2 family competence protein [Alphaproteobacteria bacterium]|nr:ComEC/Rec2 family competence protein [Alphaproteobacteria bacterium]